MSNERILEILQQEKDFFVNAATKNKEEEHSAGLRSTKLFHKGKYQAYGIAADCIQDAIDLIKGIISLELEALPTEEELEKMKNGE